METNRPALALLVNNTGTDIRGFEPAIRAIADGTADIETVEALADIFAITALADRVLVDFA